MSPQTATAVAIVSAALAILSFLVNGRAAWRKENRDQEQHNATEADRTIALLKEQNELLCEQNDELKKVAAEREKQWRDRETEWRKERKALTDRLERLESDYRTLVLTITTMGLCNNAATCTDYNPGDRRTHAGNRAGGTDQERSGS